MPKPVSRAKGAAGGAKRPSTRKQREAPKSRPTAKADRSTRSTAARGKSDAAQMPLDLGEVLPEGKLYYRIGEVSKITGVKAYVLRYWESEFRWMAPQKSRSKQRLYRRKDIETILLIRRLLYEERYTIAGARLRLRDLGSGKASSSGKADKSGTSGTSGDSSSPAATPERGSEAGVDAASWAAAQADYRGRFQRIKQELAAIRASL